MTTRFTLDPPLAPALNDPSCTAGPWRQREPYVKVWDPPLASTGSWAGRMSGNAKAAEAIFRANMAGSQAERVVIDCLRELRDIPEADRLYAHELTDAISAVYLDLAWHAPRQRDAAKIRRRTMALWKLFRIGTEEKA